MSFRSPHGRQPRVPGIHYDVPGDAWNDAQKDGAYKWNCAPGVGKDLVGNFFKNVVTGQHQQVVGALWVNDADGNVFRSALPALFKANGYTLVDPGRSKSVPRTSRLLSASSRAVAWNWSAVWPTRRNSPTTSNSARSSPSSRRSPPAPKPCCSVGHRCSGRLGRRYDRRDWYHPKYAYKSDVTGMTAQQYCDDFEASPASSGPSPFATSASSNCGPTSSSVPRTDG